MNTSAHQTITSPNPKARVLLVDDELHVRSALARSLGLLGYHADKAGSGLEALEMLEQTSYDVLVLDIRMPGMDGIEVMHRARAIYPDLLVIILTGHATLDSAIAAVKSGAVDYLRKPVSVHDIASAAAKALETRASRRSGRGTGDPGDEGRGRSVVGPSSDAILHVGPITLDQETLTISIDRGEGLAPGSARLTISEATLLTYLMERAGTVVSCHELAEAGLGYNVSVEEAQGIIRPHISRLRNKIRSASGSPQMIRTILGKGYLYSV